MGNEDLLRRHAAGAGGRAARSAAGAPGRPTLRTVVVTCMDARIDVYTLFGLAPGEAHVLRNAGGIVTDDVVRSIAISQRKLGTTDVLLVHHSGCGMATFTDEEFSDELAAETGTRPPWRPGAFRDAADDVRRGVARLRGEPFLRDGTPIRGFVVDITTFALEEISPAVEAG
ncbi:beta-class carbonic anhydrase [Pseudonocardia nigra]|uniref:beta-class carbonic anhydrase n=1 Tax=Pseudonocardia nigra TaxID=1921578 RepID=UPI001C604931|nr:carbonic anhydrase [Pseudonocardia nigra]